jgi:rubrerythrin
MCGGEGFEEKQAITKCPLCAALVATFKNLIAIASKQRGTR